MSDKAWEELIDLIDTKYQINSSDRREEVLEDDHKLKRIIESICFEKDKVKYKIERITSPRVIDKKTFYSGQGMANRLKYVYDPIETTKRVIIYKQLPDGHYNEITPEELMVEN
jgi:hypothetical protein